jgi:hypothetical protein
VNAYCKAWKKAYRNQYGKRRDHYIEKAFEEWYLAVNDSTEARNILGPWYDEIQDFDKLPNPRGHHVRRSKKEIEASVWAHFDEYPAMYQPEEQKGSEDHEVPAPSMLDIWKKHKGQ